MVRPTVYPLASMNQDPPPPLDGRRKFLAEGDSWATIGTLKPIQLSNLLFELRLSASTAIVNCAHPGDTLKHIVESIEHQAFNKLLYEKGFAHSWDAIVISAGGNDFIDAMQVPPATPKQKLRLLLRPDEIDPTSPQRPERYISESGWVTLINYLLTNFRTLIQRRDQGINSGRPIFLHTYARPTVRPSGATHASNGWLYPAFEAYQVPQDAWQEVSDLLFQRLRDFILDLDSASGAANALPAVHVFDSAALTEIEPACPDAKGKSHDWVNEIHLTKAGFRKIGKKFGPWIDEVLETYPKI